MRITRQRCWYKNWALAFDIKGLFDNISHDLLMKAVCKHTQCKWLLLYIDRWLKAPMVKENGANIGDTTRWCYQPCVSKFILAFYL
ncbi:hypothetical protein [Shewanella sp. KX20019]|uniref:hypothetical protein n=1 Tax=Shewanella sp. KX20019 TaxID=2803864 RepID=UPI003FA7E563